MRTSMFGVLAVVVVLGAASPAAAHDEISPSDIPIGKAVFLTLLSANESRSAVTRISIAAPAGVQFGAATRQPTGWTAERSTTAITWTGGSLAPGAFDEWGFELEPVDQPGSLRFRVTTTLASGGTDTHSVDVTAGAPAAAPTTVPTTRPPTETAAPVPDEENPTRANVALAFGGVALVLALVAVAVALRSRQGAPEAHDW